MKAFLLQARGANEVEPAPTIDHCQAAYPYQSKYGDAWEEKIVESTHMKKCEHTFIG